MKNLFFTLFISILFVNVYSQEKLKKIKIEDKQNRTNEEFYVLKSNTSIKNGNYQKRGIDNKIYCEGQYLNNEKVSIWNYYDYSGKIDFKYDFGLKKVIEFNNEENKKDSLNLYDVPAILFISSAEFLTKIQWNTSYPMLAVEKGISGKVSVLVNVDKSGKIMNYSIKESVHELLDNEALRVIKLITKEIEIIPAIQFWFTDFIAAAIGACVSIKCMGTMPVNTAATAI